MTSDVPLMTASVKKQTVTSILYIKIYVILKKMQWKRMVNHYSSHAISIFPLNARPNSHNIFKHDSFYYVCNIQFIVFILLDLLHIPVCNNSTCIMCSYYFLNMLSSYNSAKLVYLLYLCEHINSLWCEQHKIKWISFQLTTQSECMFQKHYSVIPYFFPQNTNS